MSALSRLLESRLGTALVGMIFVVLMLGLSVVGVAYGFGVFSHSETVTADLPEAGPALGPGSEVQYRGVLVGSLGKLRREPHQAVLTIDVDPGQLEHIPADVTVRLVPRSVFGDLYVDLVPPAFVTGHLQPGAVLRADTSTPAVELNQALDSGYQLLTAVRPSTINSTLTAIATALNGRGAKLGVLVSQLATYTTELAPHTAQLVHDITVAGSLAKQVSENSPDLFRIIDDSINLSNTIAADQPTLARVLSAGPVVATQTDHLLSANRDKLNAVLHQLRPVITILDANQDNLGMTLFNLEAFTRGAAEALGHGPYLQVAVSPLTDTARGQLYNAKQCPHYRRLYGPNCGKKAAQKSAIGEAVVQALVAHASGADTTKSTKPGAVTRLKQRLEIAKVLLAPILRSAGGLL